MRKKQAIWKWAEVKVDPLLEHLDLTYGDAERSGNPWYLLALVGKPEGSTFPVQWMLKPKNPHEQEMLKKARDELDFYLVNQGYNDPWLYACYHCGTASNIYSPVHWSYYPHGCSGDRFASTVIGDKGGKAISIVKPDIVIFGKWPG